MHTYMRVCVSECFCVCVCVYSNANTSALFVNPCTTCVSGRREGGRGGGKGEGESERGVP